MALPWASTIRPGWSVTDGEDFAVVNPITHVPHSWPTRAEAEDAMRSLTWHPRRFAGPFRVVPGAHPPAFGFDGLQDAVMDRTGLRGPALHRAWLAVKGRIRLRWAAGNRTRPSDAAVARWALDASQRQNPASRRRKRA